jgi:hypothetical protein
MELPKQMALPCKIVGSVTPGRHTFFVERSPGIRFQGEARVKDLWWENGTPVAMEARTVSLCDGFVAVAAYHSETEEIPVVLPNGHRMTVSRSRLLDHPLPTAALVPPVPPAPPAAVKPKRRRAASAKKSV